MNKNSIILKQSLYLKDKLQKAVQSKTTLVDFYRAVSKSLNDFLDMAFKPSFKARKSFKFSKNEQLEELEHIVLDLNVINDSVSNINDTITSNFNDMQIFKSRARHLLGKTKDALQTLNFVTNNSQYLIFHDSFNDYSKIDQNLTDLATTNVMTTEGILTLPVTEENKQEVKATNITYSSSNGSIGNYGIVEKAYDGSVYYFLSAIDAKDNLRDLLDDEPNTWVEFQGNGNTLDVSISIKFASDISFNWISLDPYIPFNSNHTFKVKSIQYRDRTSVDFQEINIRHQDKEILLMISEPGVNKYENQGVYLFSPVTANELVIKLTTDKGFVDKFGSYRYDLYSNNRLVERNIGEDRAKVLISGIADNNMEGLYNVNLNKNSANVFQQIKKTLVVREDYRKVIGLRNIQVRLLKFKEKSEIFSVLNTTDSNISEVKLSTIESINGLQPYGQNISYFISFDDHEWLPIRPNNQLFGNVEAPIAYHINSYESQDMKDLNQNIGYINGNYKQIRLKIVLQSTTDNVSPMLEQYVLFCKTAESEGIQ